MQEDIKKEEEKKKYQTPEFDPFNLPVSDVARQDKLPSIKQSEIYNLPGYVSDKLGKNFKPQYGVNEMFDLYDKTLKAENDAKASEQSYLGNWSRFLGKTVTSFLGTVAATPGYLYALGETALTDATLAESLENSWINAVENLEESVESSSLIKTYVPTSVTEGSMWDKLTSSAYYADKVSDVVGMAGGLFVPGGIVKGLGLGKKLLSSVKWANRVDNATAAGLNALVESSMEARETMKSVYATLQPKIASGEMTEEEAKKIVGDATANTFKDNAGLLFLSNLVDQKWLFGGEGLFKNLPKVNRNKNIAQRVDVTEAGISIKSASTFGTAYGYGSKIAAGILKEGLGEEGGQYAIQKYEKNKALGLEDEENTFLGIAKTYLDSFDETEFQESVMLGGLLGMGFGVVGERNENKKFDRMLNGDTGYKPNSVLSKMFRSSRPEKKGIKESMEEIYINKYKGINDLYEKDKEGKIVLDENTNKPKVDKAKLAEFTIEKAMSDINRYNILRITETIEHYKKNGLDTKELEASKEYWENLNLYNSIVGYLEMPEEAGRIMLEKVLPDMAEKESILLEELTGEKQNPQKLQEKLLASYDSLKSAYDATSDRFQGTLKISAEKQKENPSFVNELFNQKVQNKLREDAYDKVIQTLDAKITKYSGSKRESDKDIVAELEAEKADMLEEKKFIIEHSKKLNTKQGQEELYNESIAKKERISKAMEDAVNEEAVITESQEIKNTDHAGIYTQLTVLNTVDGKRVKSNGAVKFEYTTKDGKLFRMTAEVIGVEDGKLVLKDIKDPKSVPFTLEVDNTFNGNTISSEIEIAFTGEDTAAAKTSTNTGENTPEEHNKSQEELISTAKVDKDLDVNVGSSEPKPRFNLETLSMFLRTIGNQEDYEGSGMTSFSNMYSLIEEIATNQNIKDFYFKVHTKNNTSEKDPLILKLKKEGATFEEGWILLVAYKKGSDIPYQLNGVEGNIAVTWVPDPMLGYLKNQSKKLGNYSWGELAEIPDAQQRNNSINTAFLTGAQIFEESVRKPLLENTEVITIPFGNITRGKIVGSEENNLVDSITGTVEGLSSIELSTVKTGTYKGLVSIVHRGVNIPLLRNNIDSKTASEIIDLMKLMLDDTTSLADKKDIKKYLDSIVYISQERGNHKYSLSILSSKRKIVGFQIAIENEKGKISYATYKAETFKNKGAVNKLQSFLETKFFNINEKSVKGDFIVRTVKKGKLESKAFSKSKGGYLGYMHSKNAYSVKLKPLSENQFLNRAITLPIEPKLQGQPKTTVAEVTTPSTTQFVLTERGIKQAENLVEVGQYETIEEATEFLLKQGKKAFVEQLQIPVEQQEPQVPLPKTEQDNNDFAPGEEPTVDTKADIERRLGVKFDELIVAIGTGGSNTNNLEATVQGAINRGVDALYGFDLGNGFFTIGYHEINSPNKIQFYIFHNSSLKSVSTKTLTGSNVWSDISELYANKIISLNSNLKITGKELVEAGNKINAKYDAELATLKKSTTASVPITITSQVRQQLYDLGYSKQDVDSMKPEEGQTIISNQTTKPKVQITISAEEIKAWRESKEELGHDVSDLTDDQIREKINKSGKNKIYREEQSTLSPEVLAWFKKKFPGFTPEFIENGLIDGVALGRVLPSMRLILSPLAGDRDIYHEAFHIVFNFFLNKTDRTRLYNETKNRLGNKIVTVQSGKTFVDKKGSELTNDEIEEFLAEENADFLANPSTYKFNKGEEVKQGFFKRLWNAIKSFFGVKSIEEYFEFINSETFDKSYAAANAEMLNPVNKLAEFSEHEKLGMLNHFNARFFENLTGDLDGNFSPKNLFDLTTKKILAAQKITVISFSKSQRKADQIVAGNVEEIQKLHFEFLKQYGFSKLEEALIQENDRIGKNSTQFVESATVNVLDNIPSAIQLLFASIPQKYKNVNGEEIAFEDTNGFYKNIDVSATANTLYREFANLPTQQLMWDKLYKLSKGAPHFNKLAEWIGLVEENGTFMPDYNATQETGNLRRLFYSEFAKNRNNVLEGVTDKVNKYSSISSTQYTLENKLMSMWKNNLGNSYKKNKFFFYKNGLYRLNVNTKLKLPISISRNEDSTREIITGLYNSSILQNPKEKVNYEKTKQKLLKELETKSDSVYLYELININDFNKVFPTVESTKEYMNIFGIELDPAVDLNLIHKFIKWSSNEIANKTKLGKKLILEDFYDQNSNKIGKELRELANDQLAYQGGNNLNNMYTTSNGSSEYAITLNTTYSKNIDKTRYKLENEFTPWSITNKGGNLTTVYSSWQEAADDLRMTVMRSIKQDFGQSKDIASATEGDIFQMHFNQMFLGVSAMIPAAARGMDYGVKVMKNFTKNNLISHSDMVMELSKHLKVEIITALAYKNEPQFSRLKSSKYAKSLRIFRKHLPMLNKLISNYEFKEGEEADYITIAEQLIDENSSYVTKGLTTLVVELQDDTMQLIEKTRLFESFDGVNYINNGFNMEKQKSFFNTDQTIAKEEVEYLASNFAFLYFVNGIETLKYGIGEISTYAKEKESGEITSDTFKRATTAAGTTTTPANEDVDISDYNKYYNRADGYSHSKNMKFITFKDVFEDSTLLPMLKAMGFENAYSKIKKTDAHGITFLDGMRAFRLRNKSWNDKAEMTYQYTMQNYLLGRVAESKELLDVLGTSKEALLDRFKDHLPKEGWKGVPHFKGKPIDITEMEPITPEKPLGVGKYKNGSIAPSGATAVIKTAIFPVFPNNLINTPLEKWMLSAMKEGLDFMFPESALKGDTIGNEKGELPELFTDGNVNTIDTLLENNFIPSLFDWSDFGSQLEIDPSGKTKVGESTQKVSEQSLDTLELGEEIFEGAKTLIDESSNLRNAKSEILYKNALTYFGIKELEDGTYKLEDKEKLIKALKSEFNRKTYDENALNGIKKVLDSDLKIMDTLTIVNNIQYVITSMIDSKMGKHEVKGDMLVQSSQVLSETLNAYVGLDSEGKETQELSKIVKVKPAETILTLPKDLINYVDTYFEGKTFEEKLARFNAVLYKPEYDSAFTFTLNRIPNKHITNIEVFRVKKFLPPWEGNTIIIPKEIMVKSGSDFDVDKLFTYFNNLNINTKTGKITKIKPGATVEERYIEYIKDRFFTETESNLTTLEKKEKLSTNKNELQKLMTFLKKTATYKDMTFEELLSVELENKSVQFSAIAEENKFMSYEEFSKLPTLEQYSIKAIDNRLSEITAEFVLNPKNLEAFYRPDDNSSLDKAIKKRLTDKKTLIKEDAPYHKQLTYSFGLGYKASQFRAQETLGIAANATTMHSKMQISPVAFNQDIIYIPYKGVSYKMGIIKDAEGKNKISIVLGDKITGTVDAEKQLFPLIVQGGLTTATIGVSVILLETGVKIDDILALVNHDMVKEYLAQRHINESKFLQASFIDKKKNTIINELVGTTSEYIENNFLHSLFTKMLDNPSEENTKNFQDRLETFKDVDFEISEDMLVSKPHMALEYYLYMEQVSKVHADLSQVAKPETKKSMSLDSIVEEEYRINEIKKTNVYDNETIDNLFENTFLKGFRKNKIRGLNMFKEFFMELNGDLGNNIEIMLTPFNKKGLETKMAIKRKLINRTITYIIQKQLVNEKTLAGVVDRLFFSENSLVERILRKKNDDPLFANNPFIANILEVSEKFDRRNNYKLPLDHLEAIASKLDSMSSNSVIRSYHELMESKDSEIKQIAKDIIAMGLIQHGSISSKTRYIDFVPVEYTQPVIHTILNEFYKTGKKLTEEDRIQILQNAWYDAELVPRENKAKPQFSIPEQINTLKISAKNKNFKFNLIAVKTKMTGYNFDKAYENQKVEFEDVRLFLKDELNSNETSAIYKEIPKKGIRGVITEVSIYHSDPSKISSNNTNDRTKDGYRFNRTKGKLSKPKREKADPQSELDRQLNFSKLIEENDDALYSYQEFGSSIYEEDDYFYNEMQSSTRMTQEEAEQRQFEGFKEFKQAEEVAIAEEIQKELKKAEPAKVIPTESTEEQTDAIKELLSLSDEELIMDLFNNYLEAVKSSFPSAISSRGGIVLKKLKVLFDEYSKEEVLTRIIKCHS